MKDADNDHNAPCERAKLHRCRCATCGGSLHGFTKWLEFVDPPGDDNASRRDGERRAVDDQLKKAWRTERSRRGRLSRRACVDFFRFSLVDWLARDRRATPTRPIPASADPTPDGPITAQRGRADGAPDGATASRSNDAGGRPEGGSRTELRYNRTAPADEKIWSLARAVAVPTWAAVKPDLDRHDRKEVAETHLWCGLFLALAEAVQSISDATEAATAALKERVKRSIPLGGRTGNTTWLTEKLIDKIVDTAVSEFVGWLGGIHVLFDPEVRDEIVRLLRVLAVLCCPAPSDHEALRKHAMAPLAHDAAGVVSEAAKDHMNKMFAEWMETGEVAAPRRDEAGGTGDGSGQDARRSVGGLP